MQAERDQRIKQDVTHMQQAFFCQTCSKQYKNAAEMEAHLSSYDHHHRKRLIEMRSEEAERTRGTRDRKEKKRADKEMARLQAQIQAAQAAQAAASVPSVSDAPPPVPSEEPPPLPPLPPEQEEEGTQHPAAPPLPPPPPCEPPYPPHPVSLLTTQTQLQAAFNPHSVSQQSAQQHPGHYSHQQFTQQQPYDYSRQQGALQQPSFRTVQLPQGSNPSASRAAASRQGNGGVSAVQVKTEAVPNASFSAALPAVKTEAGTTVVQTGSRQQQGPQSGGAIQFGFGGRGKPSGKTAGMLRPLAKPGSKKPGLAVKSALAIFGSGDSDDE